jgi:signal recognition particle receptor subunit beta
MTWPSAREHEPVQVRIVYDGSARAGKTTSVRALAESFQRPVESPGEAEGRTLLFDWMEHIGGLFEGRSIRFQVISVPGQRNLEERRLRLVGLADAIVVVADSSRDGIDELRDHLLRLRSYLEARGGPPVGILVQANKRDLEDAVSMDEIRRSVEATGAAVVESVATTGEGVRSAFLQAVRLALDRIREQREGSLEVQAGLALESSDDLLDWLRGKTGPSEPVADETRPGEARQELRWVLDQEKVPQADSEGPFTKPMVPRPEVPGSHLWPGVRGRMYLIWAWSDRKLEAQVEADGAWQAKGAFRWHLRSHSEDRYATFDEARAGLEAWTERHRAASDCLSPGRALAIGADALDESGAKGWRLWQFVQRDPSLQDLILDAAGQSSPREVADRLWNAAQALIDARVELLKAKLPVTCTLESCGVAAGRGVYLGWMPSPRAAQPMGPPEDRREFLRLRFAGIAEELTGRADLSLGPILDRLQERSLRQPSRSWVTEALGALLIEA